MRIFLLIAAMTIGVANATLYSFIGNNTFDNLFEWRRDPWSLYMLYAFTAIFVGLLISGTLLRFAEGVLRETFFARYGLMVLTICLGGAALAVFLTTVTFLFDPDAVAPSRISETTYTLDAVYEDVGLFFDLRWALVARYAHAQDLLQFSFFAQFFEFAEGVQVSG